MLSRLFPAALACGLLGAFSGPPCSLQDPAREGGDGFVLEAGEHEVRALIERSAAFLRRNHVFSEAELANAQDAKVRLQNRMVLDAVGCEEVVTQLAYTRGFVMIPVDDQRGVFEWINMAGPKRAMLGAAGREMTPQQVRERRHLIVPVRVLLPLQHIDANTAANQLRPFFSLGSSPGNTLTVGSVGHALLLQGLAPHVASAVDMVLQADVPPKGLEPSWEEWRQQVEQRLATLEQRGKQAPQ